MEDKYDTFELVWLERTVAVSYQFDWLHTGHCHIELRSPDRLPVTETGYRSHFLFDPGVADRVAIAAFVIGWLDAAADTKVWKRYLEDSRQLDLF